jgi:hypothetical protein
MRRRFERRQSNSRRPHEFLAVFEAHFFTGAVAAGHSRLRNDHHGEKSKNLYAKR